MIDIKLLKRHAVNGTLCVLALASAVWAVADRGSVTTAESERRKRNLFPAWRNDDVTRIAVQLPNERYELDRRAGPDGGRVWDLKLDGAAYPADEQVVDRLLGTFEYATFTREVPSGTADRAELGLDAPTARYEITMGTLTFRLAVGKPNAAGDGTYVEVEGRGVYLVAAALARSFEVPAKELRGRDFVPYFSTDLAKLTLEGEGGTRVFERAPWSGGRGSGFRFSEGTEGRAGKRVEATRLDQVFVAFGRMQAQTFLTPDEAKSASKPRVTITMDPKSGARGVIALGGECPGKPGLMVAVRSEPNPLAVCVPEGVITPLVRPIDAFDDDGLLGATFDEITEVKIERAGKVLDFVRSGPAFRMRQPEARDIVLEVGNAFLESLTDARGSMAAGDASFADGERTKVRVVSLGGMPGPDGNPTERVEEIELGPAEGGGFVALRKEDGVKLSVGDVAAQAFRPDDLALRDAVIFNFSPELIEGMTIKEGTLTQRFQRDAGTFQLLEPKGKGLRADMGFAQEAIAAFGKLRAQRWAARTAEASFGLSEPRFEISAQLAEGATSDPKARELAIRVGARTDDGAYAQVVGKDDVFIIPRRFEELMHRLYVSREEFPIPPELIERVVIEHGDKKLTLARDGKQLKLEGGGGSAKESEIVAALGQLTPQTAVALGGPTPAHGLEPPAATLRMTLRRFPDDPPDAETKVVIMLGAADVWDGIPVHYARREGIDAIYAIPQKPVRTLLSALAP